MKKKNNYTPFSKLDASTQIYSPLKYYIPAIIWALIIAALSLSPNVNLPDFNILAPDKLAHMFVYGLLVFLTLWGISKSRQTTQKEWIYIIIGCSLYGILLEVMQYSLSVGRYFEILDILANIIGAIVGAIFFSFLKKHRTTI